MLGKFIYGKIITGVVKLSLQIAICDDEPIVLDTLSEMVDKAMAKKKISYKINTFSSEEKMDMDFIVLRI